jgi:hypothetical protein
MNRFISQNLSSETKITETPKYLLQNDKRVRSASDNHDVCSICKQIYHIDNLMLCDYCIDKNRCKNCILFLSEKNPSEISPIISDYDYYSKLDNRIRPLFIESFDEDGEEQTFCVKCWKIVLSEIFSDPEVKSNWLSQTYDNSSSSSS